MSATSPLSALSAIISNGIASIEETYARHGASFPSLDESFVPDAVNDKELMEITAVVVGAAAQLIATIKHPVAGLLEGVGSMYLTAALGSATSLNLPEILREAGPEGLHIREIGVKCSVDQNKIGLAGRVLRFLATYHIFREISPDVFTNNRLSSLLDTGKSAEEILRDPEAKHDNTSGIPALISHLADEGQKASAFFVDNLVDPQTTSSQSPAVSPRNRAFGGELNIFDWYEQPGNEKRFRRFGAAMNGTTKFYPADLVVTAFDWGSLKPDDLVVDVGGGIGSTTLGLVKAHPQLRYIVQDRAPVVPEGIKFWETENPEALALGRVKFQAYDFFEPQPIKDAAIFFMRFIAHDWPDEYARTIMKNSRGAAQPTTKLILVDNVVPYASPTGTQFSHIPGAEVPDVPFPLLPNLGAASASVYVADLSMMNLFNSSERTVGQFLDLAEGTGWQLESIKRGLGGALAALVFIPI